MKATFYVQLEPRYRNWADYNTKKFPLESIAATRVTQTKPNRPAPKSITVKLSIDVPESVFEPFEPQVEITIPEPVQNMITVNVEPIDAGTQVYSGQPDPD